MEAAELDVEWQPAWTAMPQPMSRNKGAVTSLDLLSAHDPCFEGRGKFTAAGTGAKSRPEVAAPLRPPSPPLLHSLAPSTTTSPVHVAGLFFSEPEEAPHAAIAAGADAAAAPPFIGKECTFPPTVLSPALLPASDLFSQAGDSFDVFDDAMMCGLEDMQFLSEVFHDGEDWEKIEEGADLVMDGEGGAGRQKDEVANDANCASLECHVSSLCQPPAFRSPPSLGTHEHKHLVASS